MNVSVVCVGGLKEKFFKDACAEYTKRLSRFGKIAVTEVDECRLGEGQDAEKEGELILKKINPSALKVALCVEGKKASSEGLAKLVSDAGINGKSEICFVIGGSDGLSDKVKSACDVRLSFSDMTFPHQLMRVILLEQVYRAFKINAGEKYHK
ncbi:MAG: 23S rRNA (pseudouridine(1915)-N(3))-methyltransferase RlmH [Clostridia bacterium]|nr:23S rRNA (pseudouridine(1915)-N(3))-methyltransferase RlmH [Clostridia bacterium]